MVRRFALGAGFAAAIGLAAYRVDALDAGGSFAAVAVGTLTFAGLGLPGAGILLTFFVSSIALSRLGKERKRTLLADVEKQHARDAAQVLANGGVAAVCAALTLGGRPRFRYAFAGALAAATADTWGTELGTLSHQTPRSVLTLRPVVAGLSGGVTVLGTCGECAGAAFLALAACALWRTPGFLTLAAAGILGAVVDSALGASVQALRWCAACERATERITHRCGAPTAPIRGLAFVGNDAVNFAATLTGALAGYALAP